MMEAKESRQQQKCAMCRNHGFDTSKKGHKKCFFEQEEHYAGCELCRVSIQRRKTGASEIRRRREATQLTGNSYEEFQPNYFHSRRKPQECRKCRNHDRSSLISGGHRRLCRFKDCLCDKCSETNELRNSMKIENKHKRAVKCLETNPNSPDSGYSCDGNSSEEEDKKSRLFLIPSQPMSETFCYNYETISSIESRFEGCHYDEIQQWITDDNALVPILLRGMSSFDSDVLKMEFDQYLPKQEYDQFMPKQEYDQCLPKHEFNEYFYV